MHMFFLEWKLIFASALVTKWNCVEERCAAEAGELYSNLLQRCSGMRRNTGSVGGDAFPERVVQQTSRLCRS